MKSHSNGRNGIVSGTKHGVRVVFETTNSLIGDLAQALNLSLQGVGQSLEAIFNSVGNAADGLGQGVKVVSHNVASGVGRPVKSIANELGNIVKNVPLVGKPTAYLVKGTGQGVHYVVVSIGDIVGTAGEQVGRVGKTASGVVVFTLVAGRKSATGLVKETNRLVNSVLNKAKKPFKPTPRKRRTKRRRKRSSRKRRISKKTRRGGRRTRRRRN